MAAIGSGFAVSTDARFIVVADEADQVLGPFSGVSNIDSLILSGWLSGAIARGIDAVIDLSARPWNVTSAEAILGVFEVARPRASWLLVRDGRGWVLARRADRFVSDSTTFLPALLVMIDHQVNSGNT